MIPPSHNFYSVAALVLLGSIFIVACASPPIALMSAQEVPTAPAVPFKAAQFSPPPVASETRAAGTIRPTATASLRPETTGTPVTTSVPTRPATAPVVGSGATVKLDFDAIFPKGAGRDLLLNNCLDCHSFVRYVLGRRTKQEWALVRRKMRPNVAQLDDAQADTLFTYLETNFNETRPVPDLPKWLLEIDNW